jgi:hypothetical protein
MKPTTCSSLRLLRLFAAILPVAFLPARADFVYTQTFTVNQTIPDFGEFASAPVLSGLSGHITDVNVGLVLTPPANDATWSGDYYVSLGHDTGFTVLLNRIGKTTTDPYGTGHDGLNILLDDQAPAGDIHLASYNSEAPATLTGTWASDGRETDPSTVVATDARTATLSSFNNLSANGEWRLFVADDSPGGTALLSSWSLHLTLAPDGGTPLAIASGATLMTTSTETLLSALVNQGLVVVADGETLTFSGAVSGAGNFQGNFVFSGSYAPGNSPAIVDFDGDLLFESGHVLTMEIGGTTPGSGYDVLNVTGHLTLGGTLEIVFIDGFTPDAEDVFDFFTGGTLDGTFHTIVLPAGYQVVGNLAEGSSFSFSTIPEPATLVSFTGLFALTFAATRRRLRTN